MSLLETKVESPQSYDRRVLDAADAGCLALLLVLAAVIFLFHYDAVPMLLWDESRTANNALEMATNGHLLVTYFDGAPDHWVTKPPLLIWLVAFGLRLGLPPLLALRLPSGIAATTIVLMVFFFCRNLLRDRVAGLLAGLTLLTGPLFVGWHAGRTGDYDIFVTLFTLTYSLSFWCYLETQGSIRTRWICVASIGVFLAVLTKGVGGVLALPGLFLYAIARRQMVRTFLDPRFWLSLAGLTLLCGAYYGFRERLDPGYLHAVWINDFASRYLVVNEGHDGDSAYYVWVLIERFKLGFMLLPLCLIAFWQPDRRRRSVALLCLLTAAFLFGVLTTAKTKNFWYLVPVDTPACVGHRNWPVGWSELAACTPAIAPCDLPPSGRLFRDGGGCTPSRRSQRFITIRLAWNESCPQPTWKDATVRSWSRFVAAASPVPHHPRLRHWGSWPRS